MYCVYDWGKSLRHFGTSEFITTAHNFLCIWFSIQYVKKCFLFESCRSKGKVKAICGSYSTAALRHIVLLPEWVPSFISRGTAHTKRLERPPLAKEGTIPGIYLAIRNLRKLLGSFTCRKAGTWDRFFYFPSGGRHTEDFYVHKNTTASAWF